MVRLAAAKYETHRRPVTGSLTLALPQAGCACSLSTADTETADVSTLPNATVAGAPKIDSSRCQAELWVRLPQPMAGQVATEFLPLRARREDLAGGHGG